jgi:hypothetical protein
LVVHSRYRVPSRLNVMVYSFFSPHTFSQASAKVKKIWYACRAF